MRDAEQRLGNPQHHQQGGGEASSGDVGSMSHQAG
jgi:hypothetical protein